MTKLICGKRNVIGYRQAVSKSAYRSRWQAPVSFGRRRQRATMYEHEQPCAEASSRIGWSRRPPYQTCAWRERGRPRAGAGRLLPKRAVQPRLVVIEHEVAIKVIGVCGDCGGYYRSHLRRAGNQAKPPYAVPGHLPQPASRKLSWILRRDLPIEQCADLGWFVSCLACARPA